MKLVSCWIEHPIRSIDQLYTYTCEEDVSVGTRVQVDFNHRLVVGFVESVEETSESQEEVEARLQMEMKPIVKVMDTESLITDELHDLAFYMRDTTLATTISCFQAILPSKMKPMSNRQAVVVEKWIQLSEQEVKLTPKQLEAFLYIKDHLPMSYTQLRKEYPHQAKSLVEKGAIILYDKEKESSIVSKEEESSAFPLTPLQEKAMREIQESTDDIYLLYGVTGSGKTEIYLQLAQEALDKGKQVLILVPEIGLTPQMIQRVSSRFGEKLAIYHSGLNAQEKYEQYRLVKKGDARIVVGTRSAVFLPFESLGLIVMDEEHDGSYKQTNQPSYHCRDIAIYRGKYHHCKVILGSATPSLDSYARALKNVYHLVKMDERINETMPTITLVNVKEAIQQGDSHILTKPLREKIIDRLEKKRQVILLLNRRGYHSLMRCESCQEVIRCPHCDLAMSYHYQDRVLKCHTCGATMKMPLICPSCKQKARFVPFGFGTERLEKELQNAFPSARIIRMDADTTTKKNSHSEILKRFEKKEADILLGTQMIAKGLDFPNVTLVGVINADEGLARMDYRSSEITFDLLMQAAGRSGRGEEEGEVLFQVYDSNHYVVQSAIRQDYDTFFRKEMAFRHEGMYPPYRYFISLVFTGLNESKVNSNALKVKDQLQGNFKVIGVIALLKIKDLYRSRILLKGDNLEEMRQAVRHVLQTCPQETSQMRIDVNPFSLD